MSVVFYTHPSPIMQVTKVELFFKKKIAGRLRAACDMISQYLPREVYAELLGSYECVHVTQRESVGYSKIITVFYHSFAALNAHLKVIQDEMMVESNAVAAAKVSQGKQGKKAKAADAGSGSGAEKKRKKQESKGVEKLKKANIKGMATISSFFKSNST